MSSYRTNAFLFSTIVAMGGFVFGLDAALISGTVNYISQEFSLNDMQLGTAVSAPGLGVLLALPFAGFICNGFGRKRAIQLVALLYLVSAVCSAFAPNYWTLVSARFLGGLAFTSISLASMYIGEIAPPRWRGKLVAMTQINIVVGLSAAYFINYFILHLSQSDGAWAISMGFADHTWRWMLGSEILPALLWFLCLFIIPESPYWLVYRNRSEEAKKTLRKILPEVKIQPHIDEMLGSLRSAPQNHSFWVQMKGIFSSKMRVIFIIAITIAIAQQSTGINAILFYAPTVFEQLGLGTDAAFMQAIWVGLVSVVATLIGLLIVDKVGRRPMIIWGMVWIIVSLVVCSYGFNSARYTLTDQNIVELTEVENVEKLAPLVGKEFNSDTEFKNELIAALGEDSARNNSSAILEKSVTINAILIVIGIMSFTAAFQSTMGPVMWVLFSEIFPISLRGIAIPFFTLITSVTSYLVQKFFPVQLATMGAASIFLFYAITVLIGLAILFKFLKETKNMSIEEIQEMLVSEK